VKINFVSVSQFNMVVKSIQINKIKNFSTNNLNQERVEEWKAQRVVPPISVRKISQGYYWLKDGSHRIKAYMELNKSIISAKIY